MNTYNDIFLGARRRLRAAGIAAHDLEARLIVAHAAGKTREDLLNLSGFFVPDKAIGEAVEESISRRLLGEPVAYIVGEWEFFGLPLTINESVLIPRIDTEVLAEEAIRLMKKAGGKTRLLDMCAGSGAVGLAVAANVPDCRVVLADESERALALCRVNMLRNSLTRNTVAIAANALELPPSLLDGFDAIVCNPPYIPSSEIAGLDHSVRDFEPLSALDGGIDGLVFFRSIAKNWAATIKHGGHLAFECGKDQAKSVSGILKECGFKKITIHRDTLGIERVVVGTRHIVSLDSIQGTGTEITVNREHEARDEGHENKISEDDLVNA